MPFLIMRRTDIPNGVLQVLDLKPNESQRNFPYEGQGQTKYLANIPNSPATGHIGAGPTFTVSKELRGLAAYLAGNIDTAVGAGGAPFTGAQADAAAAALVARAQAGDTLTLAAVNAVLAAVVAGTSLTAGGSTGVLVELLQVMAGNEWVVPAGTALAAAGAFAGKKGAFEGPFRKIEATSDLELSFKTGHLQKMTSSAFAYKGILGASTVVYADDGTLYV